MSIKELIAGAVITVVIGGTAYTVSQADIATNLAEDTGMSQQEAEKYVEGIDESDLVPYDELGKSYISDGNEVMQSVAQIDCVNFQYEWESPTLSCDSGKAQLTTLANDEIALGNSYVRLSSNSASKVDISNTVGLLGDVNADYDFEIVRIMLDTAAIDETKKTNSYNKATLEAVLESDSE